ncbi:MAG: PQQ-binding-like beta-propeller repeat protein [Anaerolineales bacterium]|nr:PQQ-binding-like beta-propeller repeat protein [Anaerolineales bacterium]
MTDRFQIVKCPSCGAPLDLKPGHERNFKCEFCGTVLQDQTTHEEEKTGVFPKLIIQTSTYTPPPMVTYTPVNTGNAGRAVGCLVAFIILATIIPIVIGILGATGVTLGSIWAIFNGQQSIEDLVSTDPGSVMGPRIYSFGVSTILPSDNDTQPDFVGVADVSDDTNRLMYLDLDASSPQRWQSEPLPDEASYIYNPIVANNSFVYFSFKTKLYAFSRADGTTAWQTTLPDEVTNICEDCLQVTGQRVIALTADGTLQAFDAQTGQPVWNVKLNEQPRQMLMLGGNPAVKDNRDDHISLFVYNALDGTLLHTVQTQCVNKVFEDDPQEPYIYDPMWPSPDGKSVMLGFGLYEPYCLQMWDGTTGTMTWEAQMEDENGDALRPDENVLISGNTLYLYSDRAVWMVNIEDGTYKLLVHNEDYELHPIGVVQDAVIMDAYRRVGTSRNEVWAVNNDGSTRWTFVPAVEDKMDGWLNEVAYEDGVWTILIGQDAVYILTAYSDPQRISFEQINLQDGTGSGPKTIDISNGLGSVWFSILKVEQPQIWVTLTNIVAAYNFETGEQISRWP